MTVSAWCHDTCYMYIYNWCILQGLSPRADNNNCFPQSKLIKHFKFCFIIIPNELTSKVIIINIFLFLLIIILPLFLVIERFHRILKDVRMAVVNKVNRQLWCVSVTHSHTYGSIIIMYICSRYTSKSGLPLPWLILLRAIQVVYCMVAIEGLSLLLD